MQNPSLPSALIVDLDQTLCLLGDRDPYNASTCEEDELHRIMADTLRSLQRWHSDYRTIIVTGRPEKHRPETRRFLAFHDIDYDLLYMRDNDDWTSGAFYKWGVFQKHLKPHYRVCAAFDDDPVVCRMWTQLGIPTFQIHNREIPGGV